jgi:hypothetical protein
MFPRAYKTSKVALCIKVRIYTASKIYRPQPWFEPANLGPMRRMLTTRPLGATENTEQCRNQML